MATLQLEGLSDAITSVKVSPDRKTVVFISDKKIVQLWNTTTRAALLTKDDLPVPVKSVAFSADSNPIMTVSHDSKTRFWDTALRAELPTHDGCSNWVSSVAFSHDGNSKQDLHVENEWISEGKEKILWLPPDYRVTCTDIWNRVVV